MKHPVAVAFGAAVGLSLLLAGIALTVYTAQQVPWALALVVLAFPFIWFLAWLITNGISWWRETTGEAATGDADEQPTGDNKQGSEP